MYQLGQKIAGDVDYITATLKGVEAAEDGTLIRKQVGQGGERKMRTGYLGRNSIIFR
ncbi:hypothetical protein bpmyx0001_27560 [Bacillus pseudomycoides DSM 12442]|nr:hypothetical protein bpmyx0001_27560 [Bacillus pseudomycoides DSM 12442]